MNEKTFIENLEKIKIYPTYEQLDKLKEYYNLLVEWNEKVNLTTITKEEDVYLKHFFDSLTISKIINLEEYSSLCDIGSGAGFPGIVLKIFYPDLQITLIDSLNKRIKFLNLVIEKLNLHKIEAIHTRIEDYGRQKRNKFDITTARAVTKLPTLLEYAIPITKVNGYFISMKGDAIEEIKTTSNALKQLNCTLENQINFNLPFEGSTRTLLKYKKEKEISIKYPRDNKIMKNHPL